MVKPGTRLLESVDVTVATIEQLKTPSPTVSDKDSEDIGQKIRYLIDQTEAILAQTDIKLSQFRDALRGAGNKTLTDLETDLANLKDKFTPILKGSAFNASVTANTNIFSSDLTPTNSPTTFRIYACLNTSGVLTVRRTRGGTTVSELLNGGSALYANAAYMFDVPVESGEAVNVQYSVNATAVSLKVLEVPATVS
jgi:hypothetical protein